MRYMEHVAPGRNGGGWFDTYSCWPIDCYLEQGYLTALSRPQQRYHPFEEKLLISAKYQDLSVQPASGKRFQSQSENLVQVRKGGTAVVTTGFASHIQAAQWAQFSSVRFTGRKLTANRYHVTDDFAGFYIRPRGIV